MLTHLSSTATGSEVAEVIRRDGAVIVDNLASDEMLERFFAEMAPYIEATDTGPDDFSGPETRRTGALLARSETAQQMVMDPLVLAATAELLGHATSFQLHLTQVISIGPDAPGQAIHRDQWAFDFFEFPSGFDVQCNTIWAGDDFTEANGATRVVPGSHLAPDGARFGPADSVPAEMERGSVLFYNGAVHHGGGANTSSRTRRGINITYNLSWLRQEENQYLSVPRSVAAEFPLELQRLMGYSRGAYALGYIDDLRDPLDAIRERPDSDRGFVAH